MKRAVLSLLVWGLASSCNVVPVAEDAGTEELADAGSEVAGVEDAGAPDAGAFDAGVADAGLVDGGVVDAGVIEVDAGVADAGVISDAGVADSGVDAGRVDAGNGCPVPSGTGPAFRLRAMAANLTSGNLQSYDPGHGARIMQGADPDIVMIQEFNYGSRTSADTAAFVSQTFDGGFAWYRGAGNIPNGVISRWPIVGQGEWNGESPDRNLTWAHVDLPGPNDLWVVSVHLPTSSASSRNLDARTIVRQLDALVPKNDYVLVGGDFNTSSRGEACFSTFAARFVTSGPYPVDQFDNDGTNSSRSKPYDNVFASPCLAKLQRPTVVGTSTFDAGLVIDTRDYTPLADLAPARQGDSAAPNMQHMGVVRDFVIEP